MIQALEFTLCTRHNVKQRTFQAFRAARKKTVIDLHYSVSSFHYCVFGENGSCVKILYDHTKARLLARKSVLGYTIG